MEFITVATVVALATMPHHTTVDGDDPPAEANRSPDTDGGALDTDGGAQNTDGGAPSTDSGTHVTRRRALTLAGAGLVAGAAGSALGDSHDALVVRSGGQFVAENGGAEVYAGGDFLDAMQAAVDSLTPGRTTKETVRVDASGSTGTAGGLRAVDLPSYTVFDVPGSIDVTDSGEPWVIPVRAQNAEAIEIPRLTVTGNPRYGIRISHCTDVAIGDVTMDLTAGLGIRIDGRDGPRTRNVTLDSATITGASTHAVETYGVDDIEIGTVTATDVDTGAGLLLNDTTNASVGSVDATRCDEGGGYAGFRCANDAGPNITVDRVDAVDCGRGVFTVSGSSGITIRDVHLQSCEAGALIQDTRDTTIDGGTIVGNVGEGVRIDSRDSDAHPHTRDVTVQNLQIHDNGSYGVYETGPDTEANAILDNDFCGNGTTDVQTYAANTTVSGNTNCQGGGGDSGNGGGSDGGSDDGGSGSASVAEGTYHVTNANSGKFLEVANAGTSDGDDVRQYADTGHPCQEWDVIDNGDGTYTFANANSGKLLEVANADTSDGANVRQWADTGHACQDWAVVDNGDGTVRLENANSGSVADVQDASTDDGATVLQWPWHGGSNQRWSLQQV